MSLRKRCKASFSTHGLLLAILITAALTGCTGSPDIIPYSIAGRITQASDGSGLDGIILQVSGASSVAITSGGGHWSTAGLTGTVTVTPAEGQGWIFTPPARTVSRSANDVDFVALPPTYPVSGRVSDNLGNPISGATITFGGFSGSVVTDRDGSWTKSDLSGVVTIAISHNDWVFTPSSRVVDGATSDVDFIGSRKVVTYSVSGRICDSLGNPISGVMISFGGFPDGAVTDRDGTWAKSGLSGVTTATPFHDDWIFTPSSRVVDGATSDVDFVGSSTTYSISGRVTDNLGNPRWLVAIQKVGHPGLIAMTETDGTWTADGLSGAVTIAASEDGWIFSPTSRVVNGPASDVDFVGSPTTYSVSGRVCDSLGNPIKLVMIQASGHYGIAMTDADGVWTWGGLSGTVTFTAEADGWTFSPSSHVVDGAASDVDFVGSPTTYSVSGRVCDNLGNPIKGAIIDISGRPGLTATAADGTWSSGGLSGMVTVTPIANGWTFSPTSRVVDRAASDVDFAGTYHISGRILDASGTPIGPVRLNVFGGDGNPIYTDAAGYWAKSGLSGNTRVVPDSPGWMFDPSSRTASGPSATVDFVACSVVP